MAQTLTPVLSSIGDAPSDNVLGLAHCVAPEEYPASN